MNSVNTAVEFCGKMFKNPILPVSGTFGNGLEYGKYFDLSILGGITSKAVTFDPRSGNPQPRICEVAGGMLNSIGLENPGLDAFERDSLPFLMELESKFTQVFINISGSTVDEYREIARRLREKVGFFEVNISCPNVKGEGMAFGQDPRMAFEVIKAVKEVAGMTKVIAKLTPNVTDIASIARAVEDAGADGISLINTVLGMRIDPITGKFGIANKMGGLSGHGVFPVAVRCVYQVAQAVKIPIIGMGGVSSGLDVIEMMRAGATLVGIGTANFLDVDNLAMPKILDDFKNVCQENKFLNVSDLIGAHA